MPPQDGECSLQLLDHQCLGVDLGVAGRNLALHRGLQRGCESPQGIRIGGQISGRQRHG
jgi:hypothetical protein